MLGLIKLIIFFTIMYILYNNYYEISNIFFDTIKLLSNEIIQILKDLKG